MLVDQKIRCEVCEKEILYSEAHLPHDRDCKDREGCDCSHDTCVDCCWECNGEVIVPEDTILYGGE